MFNSGNSKETKHGSKSVKRETRATPNNFHLKILIHNDSNNNFKHHHLIHNNKVNTFSNQKYFKSQ
jgi:hypothetical protein